MSIQCKAVCPKKLSITFKRVWRAIESTTVWIGVTCVCNVHNTMAIHLDLNLVLTIGKYWLKNVITGLACVPECRAPAIDSIVPGPGMCSHYISMARIMRTWGRVKPHSGHLYRSLSNWCHLKISHNFANLYRTVKELYTVVKCCAVPNLGVILVNLFLPRVSLLNYKYGSWSQH